MNNNEQTFENPSESFRADYQACLEKISEQNHIAESGPSTGFADLNPFRRRLGRIIQPVETAHLFLNLTN